MKKILLAESDAFLINIYASQLRKSGYSTTIALDGEFVLGRIKNISPDLLLLDAALPCAAGFSGGLSVLKTLREDMGLKDLKVVMLSSFEQEQGLKEVCGAGVIKCFSKAENTAEEIVEEIKRILS